MTCPLVRLAAGAAVAPIYVAGEVGEATGEAVENSLPAVPIEVEAVPVEVDLDA